MSSGRHKPRFSDPMLETMRQAMEDYSGAKIQQQHIMNYAGTNQAYEHAAHMANKLHLTNDQKRNVVPFPSPTTVEITHGADQALADQVAQLAAQLAAQQQQQQQPPAPEPEPQAPPQKKSRWLVPLASAAGGGLLATTAGALMWAMNQGEPAPAPTPAPPPAQVAPVDPLDPNVGLEVEGVPGGWQRDK